MNSISNACISPWFYSIVAFISKSNQQTLYTYMKGIDKKKHCIWDKHWKLLENPAAIFLQRVAREGLK